jgi:hypothetical protein
VGTGLLPLVTILCARLNPAVGVTPDFLLLVMGSSLVVLLTTIGFFALLRKFAPQLHSNGREQAQFVSDVPAGYLNASIVGAAALSLLLELAVIRWQGTVFEFFAFYKNFTLLCRAGLRLCAR